MTNSRARQQGSRGARLPAHPRGQVHLRPVDRRLAGRDPFGDATRRALDPVETVQLPGRTRRPRGDLPRRRPDPLRLLGPPRRESHIKRFRQALDATGMTVPMATTNLFTHPSSGRRVHRQRPRRAPLRPPQDDPQHRPGRQTSARGRTSPGAAARAPSPGPPRTCAALDHRRRPSTCSASTSPPGLRHRFAIEPKPNEPRGDILLPTVGRALAFIERLERPELYGDQPGGRPRADGR